MGICSTVASLAEAVSKAKAPLEPRHRLQVDILKLMPLYSEIWNLSPWEHAFQDVVKEPDDESETGLLLWEIFDFGRYNMYSAFDPAGTRDCYIALTDLLKEKGVALSGKHDIDSW